MKIGNMTEASQGAETVPKMLSVSVVAALDDHDRSMLPEVLDNLQLDTRGVKDLLHKEDMHKYEGNKKFNPKSFMSGSSVGYINLSAVTNELLFAQIRMIRELMFNVIPLSRYNHLVGNGGSKVWAKQTAQMAVPWKLKMACPMSLPGMSGCWCPILVWTSKEMFIAHWQIYHIDQHTSRILCEHKKEGVCCHYMTDREADIKAHMHKLHELAISEKLASNSYINENAWLDLTSSGPSRTWRGIIRPSLRHTVGHRKNFTYG